MPQAVDELEIARNLKRHRAFVTYGPMMNFYVDEPKNGIGSTITATKGEVSLHIKVQRPTWFDVDRIEVYENGIGIRGS